MASFTFTADRSLSTQSELKWDFSALKEGVVYWVALLDIATEKISNGYYFRDGNILRGARDDGRDDVLGTTPAGNEVIVNIKRAGVLN